MRKSLLIFAMLLCSTAVVAQDIEKEVVVTKEYTPELDVPDKLAVAPRMEDTVALRPELSYAISPVAWNTVFEQRPIAAANTSVYVYPFQPMLYVKVGAGYPLNSLGDLNFVYSESARDYVGVDLAHRGQWCNIADLQGVKRNAAYSDSRLKLFGSHSIGERFAIGADIDASHDMRRYYGDLALTDLLAQSFTMDNTIGLNAVNPLNSFGVGGRIWLGSDFTDLSFLNVRAEVKGSYLSSKINQLFISPIKEGAVEDFKGGQTDLSAKVELAKIFSRHGARLIAGYDFTSGTKQTDYRNSILTIAPRYLFDNGALRVEAGVTVQVDNCTANSSALAALEHYASGASEAVNEKSKGVHLFPYLRLSYNNGALFTPFVEADGGLQAYNYATLRGENPYIAPVYNGANADVYKVRLGLMGATRSKVLDYSIWAGAYINNRMLYPCLLGAYYFPLTDKLTRIDIGGELTFRPVRGLEFALDARYHINRIGEKIDQFVGVSGAAEGDEQFYYMLDYKSGRKPLPAYDVDFKVRYTSAKFMVGVKFGATDGYDCLQYATFAESEYLGYTFERSCPARIDLGVEAEYRIGKRFAVWAEVNNLLNRRYYIYPLYPSMGVNCTAGIKLLL